MAGTYVRIHGKGHTLCLTRTLQASFEDESFSDVRLAGFVHGVNDDDGDFHFIRANRAVLAAASPFLAHVLEGTAEEEETTLILAGCTRKDVNNLVQYIYTGRTTLTSTEEREEFMYLIDLLKIGKLQKKRKSISPPSLPQKVHAFSKCQLKSLPPLCNQTKTYMQNAQSGNAISQNTVKKSQVRKVPAYPPRPLTLAREDITIINPLMNHQEHLKNVDVFRSACLIEKSVIKHGVLSEADSSLNDHVFDYPRLADRLGIYFDPHLSNYYRALLRSSPPIRIFLDIEDEWAESEEFEESIVVKKPTVPYRKGSSKSLTRRTFSGNRLQVKSVYFLNGKTHLVLDDGILFQDDSIPQINYPPSDDDEFTVLDDTTADNEELEAEVRRKRSLLNTLVQLRRDHKKAKKVAQHILKTKQSTTTQSEISEALPTSSKKASQRMVVCEICGKLISSSWIRVHFANHLGEKNYLCEHCGRSFASANLLKSHVHYQHNSHLTTFKCTLCSKAFTKKSRLDIHMRIHSDTRPYRCPVPECGKRFHTNGNLRKHSFVHSGEKPHKCQHCSKTFSQSANLRLHLRLHDQTNEENTQGAPRMRKQETVFSCDFCPMTFSRKRHFETHRATHTGEQTTVPCSSCSQTFPGIQELKQHKLTEHPGTVHQCSICDKAFFKKTAMQRHQAIHTQGMSTKPAYKCQHCNSQFSTVAARTVHERLHTGERPFVCPVCSKAFTSKYNFRQHLRMHSDDRPFKCNQCSKAFRQPQHLRAHTYIHKSEENPVPCPHCGKLFKNKILVMSHKRIHKQAKGGNNMRTAPDTQAEITAPQDPESSLQLMDPNVGFVNILVLADNSELQ